LLKTTPLFALGIVLIPVYDTVRVFALRIWKGQSPFTADRTHIHHLLTDAGLNHGLSSKIICVIHAFILLEVYWLNELRPEFILVILLATMALLTIVFTHIQRIKQKWRNNNSNAYELR